jgi:drug/metabolite transporter (DMT)-like permease
MIEATLKGRTSSAPGKAIMCMLLGSAFLISNDAVLKWMTGNYHVGQLMFCRGIFIGVPLAFLIWQAGGLKSLRPVNPKGHLARAILVIIGTYLFISSLKYLPIADAVAITFAGPLFVTAMAPRLLSEQVGWRRWMAVFAGLVGIIVIMRPGGGLIQWAALLPLAASLAGAFRDILTRHMSAKESSVSLLFYTSLAVTLAGLATVPFVWTPVSLTDWGWFALSGLMVGGAHFLMIETFRFGEAALVAPFRYSGVIWAALLGYFVWGDIPDSGTVIGISIVVAAGIYILHRQRIQKAA